MRSKKAIINLISSLLLQLITIICGFIVPRLIITKFGSSVNGLVASITQFLAYITLLESGIGPVVKATLYKPIANKNKEQIQNILKASEKFFRIIALIFLIYLIILAIIYPLIVNTEFNFVYTMPLVVIISLSTLAEYYFGMTYTLFLQAKQKTYITTIIQGIGYVLNTIAIIVLIKLNCSIHIVKLVSGLIFVLRPLIQNMYVKKKYKINLKEADRSYTLKQKWDGLIQHISYIVHTNTDIVILTIFSTLENVSIYSIYHLIVNGINTLIRAFSSSVSSSFGDMIAKKEQENLVKKYGIFETIYIIICTIIYACTLVLITPFINVYTKNITDICYTNYLFGYLLVIGTLLFTIRTPYNDLANVAGLFKEMKMGAILEATCNILISIIFVKKHGIVGVAIGTVCAMAIRTIDLIFIANKKVLKRELAVTIKKLLLSAISIILVFIIYRFIPLREGNSYINWISKGIITFCIASLITVIFNFIFYRNDITKFKSIITELIKNKNEKGRNNEF